MEVMVAALVLGILYAAISNLQKGNRDALFRIRGRDGATEVAQSVIDELSAKGLASFTDDKLIPCTDAGGATISDCFTLAKPNEEGTGMVKDLKTVTRTWKGQPGIVPNTMTVSYTVEVNFSKDDDYKATADSKLLATTGGSSSSGVNHVFAKRVDVVVSWPFNGSTQSIKVSGVIR